MEVFAAVQQLSDAPNRILQCGQLGDCIHIAEEYGTESDASDPIARRASSAAALQGELYAGRLRGGTAASSQKASSRIAYWTTVIAPYVFAIGLLVLIADILDFKLGMRTDVLYWILGLGSLPVLLSFLIDINRFSMHDLYKNRLV